MTQVCSSRDYCPIRGRCGVAEGERLSDIWGCDIWDERFIPGTEAYTCPDVPIPSDTHRSSLSHSGPDLEASAEYSSII